jgi:hypothetical protein
VGVTVTKSVSLNRHFCLHFEENLLRNARNWLQRNVLREPSLSPPAESYSAHLRIPSMESLVWHSCFPSLE